ncbi:anterior gradient protein 3-like [Salvelinus sp. IW2-2015]|uniref:anterior gradient protein 3-like n=1 Tax=Salvelinus sp. IW2-2015 TaxID=2691554 RepID=UPI000CDF78F6|nr:anterior gradient protein 3-like [Salvelinus alpinus]
MTTMYRWSLFALLFVTCMEVSLQKKTRKGTQTLSRGWGDYIAWVNTYEEALMTMKESKKPLMVIHHMDDCPHSQALKKAFAVDKTVQKMAQKDFVMLNLMHETTDRNLAADGNYVPRIIFVDPSMTVRLDLVGKYSNRLYTYEPSDISYLARNMKKAKLLLHSEL